MTIGDPLARHSVEVLKGGQAASGALVAAPTYATYAFSWLRDSAFCAHALDAVGERDVAAAYHRWAVTSIEAHRGLIQAAIASCEGGVVPPLEAMPPARYTLDGRLESDGDEPWPNFQIDGYGMWLWAFERHLDGRRLHEAEAATVRLVARYLEACWRLKCFSCWEEFDDGEHAATLAAVVAGLEAAARLLDDGGAGAAAATVRERLLSAYTFDGRLGRGPSDARLDGSLAWLAVPFGVLAPDDPVMVATVAALHSELVGPGGGVFRYRGDAYYGGGQWLLLTSSLAWHEAVAGDAAVARGLQDWVRAQALPDGDLPEQVTAHAQDAAMIAPWVERWGPVATPLLWSHAMYLLAEGALR